MTNPSSRYNFQSVWQLPAPIETTWAALTDPSNWQQWWPGLSSLKTATAATEQVGQTINLVFRSWTGYKLRFAITITKLIHQRAINFDAGGDLVGRGAVQTVSSAPGTTIVTINWDVEVTKPWMVYLGPILRPLFRYSHTRLMASGEHGLQQYLNSR